jgi:phenylpropionate dioxygenase-like ring-hydroxylating dioxygenase large terminal subunit
MSFAASWYALTQSSEITTKPKSLTRFGERLVAWRDREGKAVVMGDSCPHFGARLSMGHVDEEGCVVCPFHRWRFDGSGECVGIPGADIIPATAHRNPLHTVERYGVLWAWWGSAAPLFALPDFPQMDDPELRTVLEFSIKTPLPIVLSNSYDVRHLIETHRSPGSPRSRTHGEPGATITREGIDAEAWCGAELELELTQMTLFETVREVLRERSAFGFWTTLSGYLGTWAISHSGIRSIRTEINGWPTGHFTRVYLQGALNSTVLTSGCPIDDKQSFVVSLSKQTPKYGRIADYLSSRFSKLQVRQAVATDAVILNELDVGAIGVYVREDRTTLEYLKLYDRFVPRVDAAWLAARSMGERQRAGEARSGQILRASRRGAAAASVG